MVALQTYIRLYSDWVGLNHMSLTSYRQFAWINDRRLAWEWIYDSCCCLEVASSILDLSQARFVFPVAYVLTLF